MLQLCDEKQMKDGFRCICKPGYHLPYCEKLADPCEENLCQNGANCIPAEKFDYTLVLLSLFVLQNSRNKIEMIIFRCQCAPGTRGPLCEEITDICVAFGKFQLILVKYS